MIDFDKLIGYEFHYPVEDWVKQQHKKHKAYQQSFRTEQGLHNFLLWFTEGLLIRGHNLYGETEQEWSILVAQFIEIKDAKPFPYSSLLILIDKAIILEFEGYNIPNLLH